MRNSWIKVEKAWNNMRKQEKGFKIFYPWKYIYISTGWIVNIASSDIQNDKKKVRCHPEFISGSTAKKAKRFWNEFRMTEKTTWCHPEFISGSTAKRFWARSAPQNDKKEETKRFWNKFSMTEKTTWCHPEFISGSTVKRFWNKFRMTKKKQRDSETSSEWQKRRSKEILSSLRSSEWQKRRSKEILKQVQNDK